MDNRPQNHPLFPIPDDNQSAADLIRGKLDNLYNAAPDAVTEAIESYQEPAGHRSKHQKFMMDLATSGKPFHQIEQEWREYYNQLPNREKHEVWEEFYSARSHHKTPQTATNPTQMVTSKSFVGSIEPETSIHAPAPVRTNSATTIADIKKQILGRVNTRGKLSRKQNLKSVVFGASVGLAFVLILMFGFFNERIIAPFITPSRTVSSTPIIADANAPVGSENKIIIPKINVEVPVVYDVETVDEHAVQEGLERGVVHYATTSNPGEQGNGAIFGHSSNNILNKGKYKFAFVLLSRLEKEDTFYIEKDGKRYVYKIFDKKVVSPEEVSVLSNVPGKTSTMALITCDPPGTTIHRLVVWGEQISPDPVNNVASTAVQTDAQATVLAGNAESLWHRIWSSIF